MDHGPKDHVMNQVLQWMCTLGKHRWLAFSNWTIVGNTTWYGDWGPAPTLSPLCVVVFRISARYCLMLIEETL